MDAIPGKVGYNEVKVSGFVLTEAGYQPHSERPWHVHDMAEFCFMLDGSITEMIGRRRFPCQRLDVTFKPAGENHQCQAGPAGARYLAVEIPGSRLTDGAIGRALSGPMHFVNSSLLGHGLRICRELKRNDELAALVIEGVALELMAHACRSGRSDREERRPPWLDLVREKLHDTFTKGQSLTELAAIAGVHPAHLTEVFRREFGCTVGEYIRSLRIAYARQLMATSDRPLAEVALAAGFADQSHFTRLFKRQTGTTPGSYRRDPSLAMAG